MPAEITMPQLSDTMSEGTLVKWHKKEGDKVKAGDVLITLDDNQARAVVALKTKNDTFHVHGREVYWLSQTKLAESVISNAVFEITVGRPSALRGINTIRQLAQKYAPRG